MSPGEAEMGDTLIRLEYAENEVDHWDGKGEDFTGVVKLTMTFTKIKTGLVSRHGKVAWFVQCTSREECRAAWRDCRQMLGHPVVCIPTPWRVSVVDENKALIESLDVD
ncbi:hypothetical protein J3459_011559 [Metarhizium acridum]|nr:hypothetical protein J3458_021942 [Metarhizium acridum]KAG8419065.1 hypothetical protein J3459_011559 [Metarhizium acridum]